MTHHTKACMTKKYLSKYTFHLKLEDSNGDTFFTPMPPSLVICLWIYAVLESYRNQAQNEVNLNVTSGVWCTGSVNIISVWLPLEGPIGHRSYSCTTILRKCESTVGGTATPVMPIKAGTLMWSWPVQEVCSPLSVDILHRAAEAKSSTVTLLTERSTSSRRRESSLN